MGEARAAGQAASLWHEGWYGHARKAPSPNYGPRPAATPTDLLVIHSISLPPGEFGNGNVQRLFNNELDWDAHPYFQGIRGLQVSSHFFISRSGELWQFVSCDARAWHGNPATVAAKIATTIPLAWSWRGLRGKLLRPCSTKHWRAYAQR